MCFYLLCVLYALILMKVICLNDEAYRAPVLIVNRGDLNCVLLNKLLQGALKQHQDSSLMWKMHMALFLGMIHSTLLILCVLPFPIFQSYIAFNMNTP